MMNEKAYVVECESNKRDHQFTRIIVFRVWRPDRLPQENHLGPCFKTRESAQKSADKINQEIRRQREILAALIGEGQ